MAMVLSVEAHIDLSRADLGLLIDALLQAESSLCVVDGCLVTARFIARMRAQQLALADRLEDAMRASSPDLVTASDYTFHVSSC